MKLSKSDQKWLKIFKALSNPHRFLIFSELLNPKSTNDHNNLKIKEIEEKGCCLFSVIKEKFKLGAPTLSHHLKELVDAKLVQVEKKGKFLICHLNEETIKEVTAFLQNKEGP